MKILSTPTAKTKNGIISNIIKVAETPMKPKIPIEAATDRRTIITPPKPRVICKSLLSVLYFTKKNYLFVSNQKNTYLAFNGKPTQF